MLEQTGRVSAGGPFCFRGADGLIWVNLMAVGHGQEATGHFLRIVGVVTIRLELPQRALIRHESRRVQLFFYDHGLPIVSDAFARIKYVRNPPPLAPRQVRPVALGLSRQQW